MKPFESMTVGRALEILKGRLSFGDPEHIHAIRLSEMRAQVLKTASNKVTKENMLSFDEERLEKHLEKCRLLDTLREPQ